MSDPISDKLRDAILGAIPGAQVEVTSAGGGHFSLRVVSEQFEGKGLLDKQRLVYGAITELMAGNDAPVHAIDSLRTETP